MRLIGRRFSGGGVCRGCRIGRGSTIGPDRQPTLVQLFAKLHEHLLPGLTPVCGYITECAGQAGHKLGDAAAEYTHYGPAVQIAVDAVDAGRQHAGASGHGGRQAVYKLAAQVTNGQRGPAAGLE